MCSLLQAKACVPKYKVYNYTPVGAWKIHLHIFMMYVHAHIYHSNYIATIKLFSLVKNSPVQQRDA